MNKPVTLKTRINRVNRALADLTRNTYFDRLPLGQIGDIVQAHGFDASDLEGIYCGSDSRTVAFLGENVWLTFTWHRMEETGRYEVVAYASKGVTRR